MRSHQYRQLKIGLDVDDTLLDFVRPFLEFYRQQTGRTVNYEQFVEYDIAKVDGLSWDAGQTFFDRFHIEGAFHELPTLDEALEYFPTIIHKGSFHIVTARDPKYENFTLGELKKYFDLVPERYHSARKPDPSWSKVAENKARIAVEEGFDCMIEDSLRNAEAVANTGVQVLMPDRPWNKKINHKNIIRCTWKDIPRHLDEIAVRN